MAEIQTAQAADGQTKVQSPQENPAPKGNANVKASGRTGTSSKSKPKPKAPKVNDRGVVETQWDNPKNDPHERASVEEDPTGKSNSIVGH
jgi:hypothetical protein